MAKKTNKTSHVLNLLTNGAPEGEEAKESQGSAAKETGAAETHATAPENKVIVVNETSENEKLSNEIKDRLEAQLEAEVAQATASGEIPAPSVETSAREEAFEVDEREPASEAASADTVPEPAVEEAPSKQEPETDSGVSEEEKKAPKTRAYNMMNVMERLLVNMESDMEEEMRQNGVCMCDRCRADVQALVLTQMPAKYVIVDSSNISPIIGYYENRYRISMLTEILKACVTVKEKPRH
ncbi:MAG: hypothetical protein HFI63_08205 [Lachnospiraceae bacterium]|nr:hypothetical protein [Lachnospiraceae bacterium]